METNLHAHIKPYRVGIYAQMDQADAAVRGLLAAGFTDREISVVCSDKVKEAHFRRFEHQGAGRTHSAAAAASGAAIGGLVGLLSMAAFVTSTGGLGIFVVGPLFVGSAGAGAFVGGLMGAMTTRGLEEELANYYDQAVVQGKILVAAEAHGHDAEARLAKADAVLRAAGAEPVALEQG